MTDDDDDTLPFDVWIERVPTWGIAASAFVIVAALLAAVRAIPMFALLVALVPSALARRFSTTEHRALVDERGLSLDDKLELARSDVVDVWFDEADEYESRVVVADHRRMLVLHLPNHDQARRFVGALGPPRGRVAGHLPNAADWVLPLRFVAIAVTLYAAGGTPPWIVLVPLVLAAPGLAAATVATRVQASAKEIEIRSVFRTRRIPRSEVDRVDERALVLKSGEAIRLRPYMIRDAMLRSPEWLERALDRVLAFRG